MRRGESEEGGEARSHAMRWGHNYTTDSFAGEDGYKIFKTDRFGGELGWVGVYIMISRDVVIFM